MKIKPPDTNKQHCREAFYWETMEYSLTHSIPSLYRISVKQYFYF